ncbi:MAG TPA: Lrp/AsnC family transcriptional regulator [Solirubrobacteraceae bacterium]|nr:Lrp/AsnC family transcriptional regulator [Solirubrobacteraceae bacterium]
MELDEIDSELVRRLHQEGRLSYEALAQAVGLSRTAVRARLDRLMESGGLRVVGVLHPTILGVTALAHLTITHSGDGASITGPIAELQDAVFVSIVVGRPGIVAELQCRDLETLDRALTEIRALEPVRRVETAIYTRVLKNTSAPVGRPSSLEFDAIDVQVIGQLQRDGRIPFAELAKRVALSPSAARTRVLRLIEVGLIQITGILNPTVFGMTEMCGFDLTLDGRDDDAVLRQIARMGSVDYLAASIGRADAVGTLIARQRSEIRSSLESIRELAGVTGVESWVHVDLVKERYERPIESLSVRR